MARLNADDRAELALRSLRESVLRAAHHLLDRDWERCARACGRAADLWAALPEGERRALAADGGGFEGAPTTVDGEWAAGAFVCWLVWRVGPESARRAFAEPGPDPRQASLPDAP